MKPPFDDGSADDDLKRYKRDQDLFFQEQKDQERHARQRSDAEELAMKLERAGIDAEPILRLRPQLLKLGLRSGMSNTTADEWASSLTLKAFYLRLQAEN